MRRCEGCGDLLPRTELCKVCEANRVRRLGGVAEIKGVSARSRSLIPARAPEVTAEEDF